MNAKNIYKGFWWQPNDLDKRFFGELIVESEKYSRLIIYDDTYFSEKNYRISTEVPVFCGGDSNSISVFDCIVTNSQTSQFLGGGRRATTFTVMGLILIGIITDRKDINISSLEMKINNENWLADVGRTQGLKTFGGNVHSAGFEIHLPISIEIECENNILEIEYRVYVSESDSLGYYQISLSPSFCLSFRNINSLDIYTKTALIFERYLSLIAGELVIVESTTALPNEEIFPFTIHNLPRNPKRNFWNGKLRRKRKFVLTEVFDESPWSVQNWFTKYKDLENTINLFFNSILYNLEPESKFVILCQAIEDYYRIRWDEGTIMDNKTYRSNRKELEEIINREFQGDDLEQFRDIVIEKLRYANQRRLVDMIEDLLKQVAPLSISSIILEGYTVKDLANLIKNTRNDLTHRGDAESVKTAQESLPDLIPRVQHLIGSHLLLELGLSSQQIQRWFA